MKKSLVLLGDSIGKGTICLSNVSGYEVLKENFIHLFGKEKQLDIMNYSRYGCTVTKGKSIVARHWEEIMAHDVVLLEYGGNDCCFDWRSVAEAPEQEHGPRTSLLQFREVYREIIEKLKTAGKKIALLNLPPLEAERYFSFVTRNKNAENILKYLKGNKQYMYCWHELYSCEIHKIADEMKVPVIDIRSAFLKLRNYRDYLCPDGIHPNAQGHRLIASCLAACGIWDENNEKQ